MTNFDPTIGMTDTERLIHRVRLFHQDRVDVIQKNQSQLSLSGSGRLIIHLVPERVFHASKSFSAADLKRAATSIKPLGDPNNYGYREARFNEDGFLLYDGKESARHYSQLYRNGVYEGVMAEATWKHNIGARIQRQNVSGESLVLRETWCEESLLTAMSGYLPFAKTLGLETPFWMLATLEGCEGARILVDRNWSELSEHAIDRAVVRLPETRVESFDIDPAKHLRPVLDVLWNAVGFERCYSYDEQGNRKPRQQK